MNTDIGKNVVKKSAPQTISGYASGLGEYSEPIEITIRKRSIGSISECPAKQIRLEDRQHSGIDNFFASTTKGGNPPFFIGALEE